MIYSDLIETALNEVEAFYKSKISKDYVYHSFDHTLDVFQNSQKLGLEAELSLPQLELLGIAAIFHDIGHSEGHSDHEERSVYHALNFLNKFNFSAKQKLIVKEAILATKMPQSPHSNLEQVLCDSDLLYLASSDFVNTADKLLEEWNLTGRSHITKRKFYQISIEFLIKHRFHTDYGKEKLEPAKEKSIDKLQKLLEVNMED